VFRRDRLWRAEAPGRPAAQRNLLLIGLGGVGIDGAGFRTSQFKQKISVADLNPAARETAVEERRRCRL